MEFPGATSANRRKRSLSGQSSNQYQPVSKLQTKHQQNDEEKMDDVLETIYIALTGAKSLLSKFSTRNTRLVPALNKIRIDDTVSLYNGPCQGHPFSSDRGEKVVLKTGLFKGYPNSFSGKREGDGLGQNNDPFQCNSPSTSGLSTTTNGTHRAEFPHQSGTLEHTRSNYKYLCNKDSHRTR